MHIFIIIVSLISIASLTLLLIVILKSIVDGLIRNCQIKKYKSIECKKVPSKILKGMCVKCEYIEVVEEVTNNMNKYYSIVPYLICKVCLEYETIQNQIKDRQKKQKLKIKFRAKQLKLLKLKQKILKELK